LHRHQYDHPFARLPSWCGSATLLGRARHPRALALEGAPEHCLVGLDDAGQAGGALSTDRRPRKRWRQRKARSTVSPTALAEARMVIP
jgi:hypothetical protein